MSGTVTAFEWTNPHAYIEIDVPDEKGVVKHWSVELGSPSILMQAGWKFSDIKVNDKITVVLNPLRSGEAGGLLVGACLTQRPDLFGAVLAYVGVFDMLRFDQFGQGAGWIGDFGSPQEPEQFKTLHAYSPLHNVRPGTRYPATMVITGDHDTRVMPAHSFKFAAALQAAQAAEVPTLIRIETRAGHGAGTPTTKLIEAAADVLAFLTVALEMKQP